MNQAEIGWLVSYHGPVHPVRDHTKKQRQEGRLCGWI